MHKLPEYQHFFPAKACNGFILVEINPSMACDLIWRPPNYRPSVSCALLFIFWAHTTTNYFNWPFWQCIRNSTDTHRFWNEPYRNPKLMCCYQVHVHMNFRCVSITNKTICKLYVLITVVLCSIFALAASMNPQACQFVSIRAAS